LDMYSLLIQCITGALESYMEWPIVSITSTLIALFVMAVIRLSYFCIIREDKLFEYQRQIKNWEARRQKAIEKKDMKMYKRVMREKQRIERLKMQVEKRKVVGTVATTVLWIILFKFTSDIVGSRPVVVFPLFNYSKIGYPTWFMVNSVWAYITIDKVLRRRFRT